MNLFGKKDPLIDAINSIRESVSKEYAGESKAKAQAARNAGKMSDYHKHMASHHDHMATHFSDKGDSRAADMHMNKATEHEAKAKEVNEAKLDKVQPKELKKSHSERKDKDIDNDGDVDSSDEYLHKRRQAISKSMKEEGFSDSEIEAILEYEISRRADGKYVDDEGNVMSRPPSKWAAGKVTSDRYNPRRPRPRYRARPTHPKYRMEETEVENNEEQQIDELSKSTLRRYANRATTDYLNNKEMTKKRFVSDKNREKFEKKAQSRLAGVKKALNKLVDEEVEIEESQLDELSKKTLGSYVRKASSSAASSGRSAGVELGVGASKRKEKYEREENKLSKRLAGISKATDRLTKEEVEIEDVQEGGMDWYSRRKEISKSQYEKLRDQMHSKPKKPTFYVAVKDGHNISQFSDESGAVEHWHHLKTGKSTYKRVHNVSEEVEQDIQEQSDREEKHEMAQTQAHFIKYAAEEILEYIDAGGELEEWYQNKLSKVHSDMESLHSFMEGEKRRKGMSEETDLDEAANQRQDMLLRAMASNPQDIAKMKRAIKMGDKALMNPVMRQEILKMLDQLMSVSLNDPTVFSKTRNIFRKRKATDTTNTE